MGSEAFAPLARLHPGVGDVIPVAWRRWRKSLARPSTLATATAGALTVGVVNTVVRPVAKRHLTGSGTARTGVEALIGTQAIVTSKVDASDGRIRLGGGEWSARAYDRGQVIPVGSSVQVIEIAGATALVWDSSR